MNTYCSDACTWHTLLAFRRRVQVDGHISRVPLCNNMCTADEIPLDVLASRYDVDTDEENDVNQPSSNCAKPGSLQQSQENQKTQHDASSPAYNHAIFDDDDDEDADEDSDDMNDMFWDDLGDGQ